MMKKNFILPLLAAATLAGMAQGADPLATWTSNGAGTGGSWDKAGNTQVSSNGNWTMKISLDTTKLYDTFKKDPEPSIFADSGTYDVNDTTAWQDGLLPGAYIASDTLGQGLFSITGSGYNNHGAGTNGASVQYESRTTAFVMGWGNSWYKGIAGILEPDNAVSQGLQLGFSHKQAQTINYGEKNSVVEVNGKEHKITGSRTGFNMSNANVVEGALAGSTFDVYRADTKVQQGDGWTITEGSGLSQVDTLDDIVSGISISSADLAIVHRTAGDVTNTESTTTLYLTVTYKKEVNNGSWLRPDIQEREFTVRYMAQINDISTYPDAEPGSWNAGSAAYDVDNFKLADITGIDAGLIDFIEIYENAHHINTDGSVGGVIPEPTSATLSMMALTALCARRRRRK